MGVSIYPIQLGIDCCYLVQDQGVIIIDGGAPGKIKAFMKGINPTS